MLLFRLVFLNGHFTFHAFLLLLHLVFYNRLLVESNFLLKLINFSLYLSPQLPHKHTGALFIELKLLNLAIFGYSHVL